MCTKVRGHICCRLLFTTGKSSIWKFCKRTHKYSQFMYFLSCLLTVQCAPSDFLLYFVIILTLCCCVLQILMLKWLLWQYTSNIQNCHIGFLCQYIQFLPCIVFTDYKAYYHRKHYSSGVMFSFLPLCSYCLRLTFGLSALPYLALPCLTVLPLPSVPLGLTFGSQAQLQL